MEILFTDISKAEKGEPLTENVQKAINELNYGDALVFPKGEYVLSTVYLKSGITIKLESGCVICGSQNFADYDADEKVDYPLYQDASHSFFHCSMFVGENLRDVTITGDGVIDMRSVWDEKNVRNMACRGAKCIALKNCKNVTLKDFSVKNCTDLAVYLAGCEDAYISGLNVKTYIDGISPDNCKRVSICDCRVEAGDDGIVFKSSYTLNRLDFCKDITVENCSVKSRCNAIKFGTETNGGFYDISIKNVDISDTRLAGIAVESVDGATVKNLTFRDIKMTNVGTPFFIHLGKRLRGPAGLKIGEISDILFENVVAEGEYKEYEIMPWNYDSFIKNDRIQYPWAIGKAENFNGENDKNAAWQITSNCCGLKGNDLERITFRNVSLRLWGGAKTVNEGVPEEARDYPEIYVYGVDLPAKAIYFRHINGLKLNNVSITTINADVRKNFIFDDVKNLTVK